MASLPVQFTRNQISSPFFSVNLRREPRSLVTVHCSAKVVYVILICIMFSAGENRENGEGVKKSLFPLKELGSIACAALCACTLTIASPVIAANQRLPPLSTEPDRCEKAFVGNTIGQANGVYDKPLDLRFCDYTNDQTNLKGKTLSAALMVGAKFDGADMTEVVMSKAYAVEASFKGVNFTNAVIDRVNFGKSNLKGAVFRNTVLSGSTFEEANLEDVVFEDTIIGYIDLQKICRNESINEEGRLVLGCR
ncbi:Tetratricopeptide repeat (TPR)-like superfamily protein [Arabidopsis thaliana]|uniref:Tetratricopeptide repeat (TPR)-like superfamily protein n=1 Tax=Arabidopsis thaliana TaxID=3702 RepID=F4JX83_ARATH|nr:Tetratricopeptide repeat (TPR)-like superfamily protein [Arabidopsis thaliana]AED96369.1 Tetratricopeptide repeat (TPR)-like superfamily protein [Arabidopsis thaliana]|eukprot:NP_001190531.1 Tetratricopeptide repeat (TPR)-like superfamily protein [Arabidopsis thaliana]